MSKRKGSQRRFGILGGLLGPVRHSWRRRYYLKKFKPPIPYDEEFFPSKSDGLFLGILFPGRDSNALFSRQWFRTRKDEKAPWLTKNLDNYKRGIHDYFKFPNLVLGKGYRLPAHI
ncbi:MAG: hypothetical protein CM15mP98_06420 [Paracoccaceae bacterium]|nr:MAG: hypothetical protein CM15mP98_06420 [Paracoccaceae bacterium]